MRRHVGTAAPRIAKLEQRSGNKATLVNWIQEFRDDALCHRSFAMSMPC